MEWHVRDGNLRLLLSKSLVKHKPLNTDSKVCAGDMSCLLGLPVYPPIWDKWYFSVPVRVDHHSI